MDVVNSSAALQARTQPATTDDGEGRISSDATLVSTTITP
jgi:hypothetical protein